jgi:hypothetical protein
MKSSMKMLIICLIAFSLPACVTNIGGQCGQDYFMSQNCGCIPVTQGCSGNNGGGGGNGGGNNGGGNGGTMPLTFQGVAWSDASEAGTFYNPSINGYELLFSAVFCTAYGDVLVYMNHAQQSQLNADNSTQTYALIHVQSKLVYADASTAGFNVFYMIGDSSPTYQDCGQYKTAEPMPAPTDSIQVSPEMFEEMRMMMMHNN